MYIILSLKRILSILLFILLLLFQYSRILDYVQCPAISPSYSVIVACDCGKQQVTQKSAGELPGAERTSYKLKPEQVFAGHPVVALSGYFPEPLRSGSDRFFSFYPAGVDIPVFQPPRV
ncbi:hypothetical protein ACX0G9_06210 [Flavitalea flava]